jgi:hypothetical protein
MKEGTADRVGTGSIESSFPVVIKTIKNGLVHGN